MNFHIIGDRTGYILHFLAICAHLVPPLHVQLNALLCLPVKDPTADAAIINVTGKGWKSVFFFGGRGSQISQLHSFFVCFV